MAVINLACGGSSDKENAPPSTVRGVAVRKQSVMKRPGCSRERRRPPLRDITCRFVAGTWLALSEEPAVVPEEGVGWSRPDCLFVARAPSNGVAVKQGWGYLLRKGFR